MENRSSAPVMSLGDWLTTFIVLVIPIVGLIMVFVWGFSKTTNPNKSNFCKATLILWLISAALFMVFGGVAFLTALSGGGSTGM